MRSSRNDDDTPLCATVGGDLWVSSDEVDRKRAAALCRTCPMIARCYAEANELRLRPYDARDDRDSTFRPWGIWGGLMFTGTRSEPRKVAPVGRRRNAARNAGDR